MFRYLSTKLFQTAQNVQNPQFSARTFTSLMPQVTSFASSLFGNPNLNVAPTRTLVKYSREKGTRKSVRAVRLRFYRLAWGGWVRTIAGRHKKLWKKSFANQRRLKQHVLCNATQSRLLDKMAGKFWMKRRYYVDDPYEPYHEREYFENAARKPKEFVPEKGQVPNC